MSARKRGGPPSPHMKSQTSSGGRGTSIETSTGRMVGILAAVPGDVQNARCGTGRWTRRLRGGQRRRGTGRLYVRRANSSGAAAGAVVVAQPSTITTTGCRSDTRARPPGCPTAGSTSSRPTPRGRGDTTPGDYAPGPRPAVRYPDLTEWWGLAFGRFGLTQRAEAVEPASGQGHEAASRPCLAGQTRIRLSSTWSG